MLLVPKTRVLSQVILFALALPCSIGAQSVDSRSNAPAPIAVPPSQQFDGNDGPWSTFTLQIGNPPQSVRVLISTYSTQTWAIAEEGCGSGDLTNCFKRRGGLYNYTASSSWVPNVANLTNQIYNLGLESNLGYTGNGRYGFDDITLGFQGSAGPVLKNQSVAGVATKDFFLGHFGLRPAPSNFTGFEEPIPSFMENLKNQSMIPSTSWAYTAGNQYRSSEVLGSLTLGGYDASKFTPNNLTFNFSTNDQPDLAVQVSSITSLNTSSSNPTALLAVPITTYLDSTIPYLYLPRGTCNQIASIFGLTYNNTNQLYTISSTQHTFLLAQNPTFTFTLTRPDLIGSPITLNFPYNAFALQATWPLVDTSTLYFPMKIANDSSQYRLGRAFFQEAYVIADYERRNFSVSQIRYDIPNQNIIPILSISNSTNTPTPIKNSTKLSTGAIVGIAVGGSALIIFLFLLLYFYHWRPKHRRTKIAELSSAQPLNPNATPDPLSPGLYLKPELDTTPLSPRYEFPDDASPKPPPQEIDSKQKRVFFELPAREEVATEVPGSANLSSSLLKDQEEVRLRKEAMGGAADRKKKEKLRWSWDRRRRASLGERSLGLGSETTETVTATETETELSSGWGDSLGSYDLTSPFSSNSGGNVVEDEVERAKKGKEPGIELRDFGQRQGEEMGDETVVGTMSSVSSGWVISPQSPHSKLR